MGDQLSGGAKCVKYLLFLFNFLFLLAGLALIIVGAVVQVQTKDNGFSSSPSSAGIFLIVVGCLIFVVSFFGCAGAINNNYCMVVTFGVLLLLILLAEVAAVIAGFVLKDKISEAIKTEMVKLEGEYDDKNTTIATKVWNEVQEELKCCGTDSYKSWNASDVMRETLSVPDSCCKNYTAGCGKGRYNNPTNPDTPSTLIFFEDGCHTKMVDNIKKYLIAVGIVAAVVALIQFIGIIFAFCLAGQLRKDYRVV